MGAYSGWDHFLLQYGGEVFLDEVSFVFLIKIWW